MPNLPPHNLSHGPLGGDPVLPFDPANGVYIYDDMSWGLNPDSRYSIVVANGGTANAFPNVAVGAFDNFRRAQGAVEVSTGTGQSGNCGGAMARGVMGASFGTTINTGYTLGYGPCILKARLAIGNAAQQTGVAFVARFGFCQQQSLGITFNANPTASVVLEYSPDSNGGSLRIGYTVGGALTTPVSYTYINCTNAMPRFGQFDWWELDFDASLNVTALLNGNVIGSGNNIAPNNLPMLPFWQIVRNAASAANGFMTIDDLYMLYLYNRR
jgi:hypothetical protein